MDYLGRDYRASISPLLRVWKRLLLSGLSGLLITGGLASVTASAQTTGIGGYDFLSSNDQVFAFDYDSSGKADHLVAYRPGTGVVWILQNQNGVFSPIYSSASGIGGFDLKSMTDRIFPLDYSSSGHLDHLVCYRPGSGVIYILANIGGSFTPVFTSTTGLGGFDLRSTADIGMAYDGSASGKYDGMLFYRPGTGVAYALQNENAGASFSTSYISNYNGKGLGGFNLSNTADRVINVNIPGVSPVSLFAYRPGTMTASLLLTGPGNFVPAFSSTTGVGGYDLASAADQVISFDYTSSGTMDHLLMYRPGQGVVYIEQYTGISAPTEYSPVFTSTYNPQLGYSNGIGSYDLLTPEDRILAFDYNSTGRQDHLLLYRPGVGVVYVLENIAGGFYPVYATY